MPWGLGVAGRTHRAAAAPSLPAHIITGYWQDSTNDISTLHSQGTIYADDFSLG